MCNEEDKKGLERIERLRYCTLNILYIVQYVQWWGVKEKDFFSWSLASLIRPDKWDITYCLQQIEKHVHPRLYEQSYCMTGEESSDLIGSKRLVEGLIGSWGLKRSLAGYRR